MAGLDVRGIAWPFRFGPRGHANRVQGVARIKQNLEGIAMTRIGERFRERGFGTVGYRLVLRNTTSQGMVLIVGLTEDGLARWERRAEVYGVTWRREDTQTGSATYLDIPFEVKDLQDGDVAVAKIGE